eukprot:m.138116 g.138116  ORF g.138116 m.138116 type:complete len:498 (+) comp14768_c0_seq1:198-1691(+)
MDHIMCKTCFGLGRISTRPTKRARAQGTNLKNGSQIGRVQRKCKSCEGSGLVVRSHEDETPCSNPCDRADVVIIGAGLGGCALALALQQRGIQTVVFEKDEGIDVRHQGYGLTMQQGAYALRDLGITLEQKISSSSHYSYTSSGNLIGCYGRGVNGCKKGSDEDKAQSGKFQRTNMHIPRQVLRKTLYDQLSPGTVRWGCRFVNYLITDGNSEGADKILVNFAGYPTFKTSVLVGADGIYSQVQKQKIGKPLVSLGVMVILGITSGEYEYVQERIFQTVDGNTRFYAMPFARCANAVWSQHSKESEQKDNYRTIFGNQQLAMWQLSFPMEKESARLLGKCQSDLKKVSFEKCRGWHHPVTDMIKNTPELLITGYPVYDRDPMTTQECRGQGSDWCITLLGDAAHPMSPFKGQGANQALLDAVCLARNLSLSPLGSQTKGIDTLESALTNYEAEMLARSKVKMEKSREAVSLLHSELALTPQNCTRAAAAREDLAVHT